MPDLRSISTRQLQTAIHQSYSYKEIAARLNLKVSQVQYLYQKYSRYNNALLIPRASLETYSFNLIDKAVEACRSNRKEEIGSFSDMHQTFNSTEHTGLNNWKKYAFINMPKGCVDKFVTTTKKQLYTMLTMFLKPAQYEFNTELVDKQIRIYFYDLAIIGTYKGMRNQYNIIRSVASRLNCEYQPYSTPQEESKNIDGYINGHPVSVKPESFKRRHRVTIKDSIAIIYYDTENHTYECDFDRLQSPRVNNDNES